MSSFADCVLVLSCGVDVIMMIDVFLHMQGFGMLSMVAASAAQSAANVVQAGTKEISSKVVHFLIYTCIMIEYVAFICLFD